MDAVYNQRPCQRPPGKSPSRRGPAFFILASLSPALAAGAISFLRGIAMFDDNEDLDAQTQAAVDHRRRLQPPLSFPMRIRNPQHRPYTPQFSPLATVTVRRLAWALQVSMPKAVDRIANALPSIFPPTAVCPSCKDPAKCELCAFNRPSPAEKAAPAL